MDQPYVEPYGQIFSPLKEVEVAVVAPEVVFVPEPAVVVEACEVFSLPETTIVVEAPPTLVMVEDDPSPPHSPGAEPNQAASGGGEYIFSMPEALDRPQRVLARAF